MALGCSGYSPNRRPSASSSSRLAQPDDQSPVARGHLPIPCIACRSHEKPGHPIFGVMPTVSAEIFACAAVDLCSKKVPFPFSTGDARNCISCYDSGGQWRRGRVHVSDSSTATLPLLAPRSPLVTALFSSIALHQDAAFVRDQVPNALVHVEARTTREGGTEKGSDQRDHA